MARRSRCMATGQQTRSFCYVDDLIEGLVRLFRSDRSEPVNLGNDGEFTMLELAELVRRITGSAAPMVREPLPVDDPDASAGPI